MSVESVKTDQPADIYVYVLGVWSAAEITARCSSTLPPRTFIDNNLPALWILVERQKRITKQEDIMTGEARRPCASK